jgi:hypothetical protein
MSHELSMPSGSNDLPLAAKSKNKKKKKPIKLMEDEIQSSHFDAATKKSA